MCTDSYSTPQGLIRYGTQRNVGWKPLSAWETPPKSSNLAVTSQAGSLPPDEIVHRRRLKPPATHHKKRPRKVHRPLIASVKISQIDDKGLGVLATKPLSAGSMIIEERPFITFADPLTSLEVYTALKALSPEDKDIFWSFKGTGAHTPGDVDVAETNLIPLEGDERCGMFEHICRLNHSCSPYARWIWSSTRGKMAVWAIHDIDVDEEITVSYLDPPLLLSSERKGWIESFFHFDCQCLVCTLDPNSLVQSTSNRASIQSAFDRYETLPIDEWSSIMTNPRANRLNTLNEMEQIETIIRDELLPAFLTRLLEYRFQLHAAWGEYEQARKVGREWEEEETRCAEQKGPGYVELCRIRKDPRKWGHWGELKNLGATVKIERPATKPILYGRKTAG